MEYPCLCPQLRQGAPSLWGLPWTESEPSTSVDATPAPDLTLSQEPASSTQAADHPSGAMVYRPAMSISTAPWRSSTRSAARTPESAVKWMSGCVLCSSQIRPSGVTYSIAGLPSSRRGFRRTGGDCVDRSKASATTNPWIRWPSSLLRLAACRWTSSLRSRSRCIDKSRGTCRCSSHCSSALRFSSASSVSRSACSRRLYSQDLRTSAAKSNCPSSPSVLAAPLLRSISMAA